ncbi:MAG: DUF4149 domain-containing protein [Conchiformibius sp.]|nr:DUF4149 domain-containing protein [Conchiformibius sp.]
MKRLSALLISLWLGMQIGFFAASLVLFNQLDKTDAGRIAGILFQIANLTGLAAWCLVWLVCRGNGAWGNPFWQERQPPRRWIALMIVLLAVSQFLLNPVIAALKAGGRHFLTDWFGGTFGTWHGASYMLYLVISLLGLILSIRLLRLEA